MDEDGRQDPITQFIDTMRSQRILNDTELEIYDFGLRQTILTSSDVAKHFNIRPSTASNRLKHLTKQGYLEESPRDGASKRSGKGHAFKYRAVHPKLALRSFISGRMSLEAAVQKIIEPLEITAESASYEGDMWLARAQTLAISEGIRKIDSAQRSIYISGRDCSWLKDPDVKEAITKAAKRKVAVKVAASQLDRGLRSTIKTTGASLVNCPIIGPNFCVIDKSVLLIPYKTSGLNEPYELLLTTHDYLVQGFVKYFEGLPSLIGPK